MFKDLFARKKPYTEVQTPKRQFTFLGEPAGNGSQILQRELTAILESEGHTTRAYLSRVQYAGEPGIRVALVILGTEAPNKMVMVIAKACQPLAAIDILFLSSLGSDHKTYFHGQTPFYVASRT